MAKTLVLRSSPAGLLLRSNRAEEAEEPSVVEERVKVDEAIEFAYEEVEDAETYSPEDLGVGGGLPRRTKRTGSSLRWSKSWRPAVSRGGGGLAFAAPRDT